jgi:hypothetical protein
MMMLHGPAVLAALALFAAAAVAAALGGPWGPMVGIAEVTIGILAAERTAAGFASWRKTGEAAALAFPIAHLARDGAWAAAIVVWIARRALQRSGLPAHSMRRPLEPTAVGAAREARDALVPGSLLVVVPAFNEAANLEWVVADIRRAIPQGDILVVSDGSTDATDDLLPALGVHWLTLSQRVGVGGAVRAGIRYALQQGYSHVVRVDGDGQHRACDIARLLVSVTSGRADAALGSRFLGRPAGGGLRRISQSALAACLSVLTWQRVTDPTSGFWLFGPRALRLLRHHHPGGYAEPELVLLLNRNGLRLVEVPIRMRPRLSGRTSLTASRATLALARTVLALIVVPFRRVVVGQTGD